MHSKQIYYSQYFLADSCFLPKCCVWRWVLSQLLHLGGTLLWSSAIHYHARFALYVVRDFLSTSFRRILFWVPETAV